jgi:hypothetical protein
MSCGPSWSTRANKGTGTVVFGNSANDELYVGGAYTLTIGSGITAHGGLRVQERKRLRLRLAVFKTAQAGQETVQIFGVDRLD